VTGADVLRQGGGVVNLQRADNPLVFADPVNMSFGLLRSGAAVRRVALADAGGGAGEWEVVVEPASSAPGLSLSAPATVTVPGEVALTMTVTAPGSGDASGWLALRRGAETRRIAYWGRLVPTTTLAAPTRTLVKNGTYSGTTRGKPARVAEYAFPDGGSALGLATRLPGPEQVFRVVLRRPVANFGVAVLTRSGLVEPRIVHAGDPQRLVGYTALPLSFNPYLRTFFQRNAVSAAVLPMPGAYDVVFDSPEGSASFTFRFWLDDTKPPTVRLVTRTVVRGRPVRLAVRDLGSAADPASVYATLDGQPAQATFTPANGSLMISTAGLRAGRHMLYLQVSDHQESKNNENQTRILPNTTRLRAVVTVR
jgi:hypothetical protein